MSDELDRILEALEDLHASDDVGGCWRVLREARRDHPEQAPFIEWELLLLEQEGRGAEALLMLDELLEREPECRFFLEARAGILMRLGRFPELLEHLRSMEEQAAGPEDRAWVFCERGFCLDRMGRAAEADRDFARAAELVPEDYVLPPRMDDRTFEELVQESLNEIPEELRRHLDRVAFTIADYPSTEIDPGNDLFGIYVGLPLSERGHEDRDHFDRILIFKRNLELAHADCADRSELVEEIRKTVIHEIGHHFGVDHEAMGDFR